MCAGECLKDFRVTEQAFLHGLDGDKWYGHRNCYYGWPFNAVFSSRGVSVTKDGTATFEPADAKERLYGQRLFSR